MATSWAPLGSSGWPPSAVTGETAPDRQGQKGRHRTLDLSRLLVFLPVRASPDPLLSMHDLTHRPSSCSPEELEGPQGCRWHMKVRESLRRDPGFPQRPQGRKRWTKKRQPKGRGACGKEADTGKEPEGAGGSGQPQRELGGSESGEMPEGQWDTTSSEKRPRSRRGVKEARGQPAPSQERCWGCLAAEDTQPQEREGSLSLALDWAARQESRLVIPTVHNSR